MENSTRELFNGYIDRQANLNGVRPDAVAKSFSVEPSVQQRMEQASMESDDFLKQINVFPVKAQEGQKILIGSNDPNFATTITNALAGKQPLDATLTDLSGKSVSGLLQYLGLGEGSALPVGVPVPWPSATPPTGWLKCNGAAFSAEEYPELAKAYPTNKLPDLRGEFIRGWDDGRGVDAGRALLSLQDDSFEAHRHESFFYAGISRNETPLKNLPSSDEMLTLSSTTNALSPDSIDATNSLIGNDDYNCLIEGNKNNKRTATGLSTSIVGAAETRPRNISFNYIVRAA
ncbi:TPA: P2 family phage major capsid protein [Escherichia coli]|nr:P2 family phage major capsid protein [Escherichia coli]